MVDAGEADHLTIGLAALGRDRLDRAVEVEQARRAASSRTIDWIQKKEAVRTPRVTGSTRWRLDAG